MEFENIKDGQNLRLISDSIASAINELPTDHQQIYQQMDLMSLALSQLMNRCTRYPKTLHRLMNRYNTCDEAEALLRGTETYIECCLEMELSTNEEGVYDCAVYSEKFLEFLDDICS